MRRSRLFIGGFLAVVVLVGLGWVKWFSAQSKPLIERIAGRDTPIWHSSDPNSVCYIDNRKPGQSIYYYDSGGTGRIWTVAAKINASDAYRIQYQIESTEEEAERWNEKSLRGKWFDGRVWLWARSWEASELNAQYREVRKEYAKTHPEAAKFSENKSAPEPKYDEARIERFRTLLGECAKERQLASRSPRGRASEIAITRQEVCEAAMYGEWDKMSENEQLVIVNTVGGYEMFRAAGVNLDTRNPLRTVREYANTPQEVDYRATWEIVKTHQASQIIEDYRDDLKRRGLLTEDR